MARVEWEEGSGRLVVRQSRASVALVVLLGLAGVLAAFVMGPEAQELACGRDSCVLERRALLNLSPSRLEFSVAAVDRAYVAPVTKGAREGGKLLAHSVVVVLGDDEHRRVWTFPRKPSDGSRASSLELATDLVKQLEGGDVESLRLASQKRTSVLVLVALLLTLLVLVAFKLVVVEELRIGDPAEVVSVERRTLACMWGLQRPQVVVRAPLGEVRDVEVVKLDVTVHKQKPTFVYPAQLSLSSGRTVRLGFPPYADSPSTTSARRTVDAAQHALRRARARLGGGPAAVDKARTKA